MEKYVHSKAFRTISPVESALSAVAVEKDNSLILFLKREEIIFAERKRTYCAAHWRTCTL